MYDDYMIDLNKNYEGSIRNIGRFSKEMKEGKNEEKLKENLKDFQNSLTKLNSSCDFLYQFLQSMK
jgi:hypothetical protein